MSYDLVKLASHPLFDRKIDYTDYDGDYKRVLFERYKLRMDRWKLLGDLGIDEYPDTGSYKQHQCTYIGSQWKIIKQAFDLNSINQVYNWLEDEIKKEKDGIPWYR